jgi:glycosyltransferase involved in cell wall biosynthesis
MSNLSVVTVTRNNAEGLRATLASIDALRCRPLEVVIIDGGSTDDSVGVVREFEARMALSFTSEPDRGIYDAMNKGHDRCRGDLIHYLNAGDTVFGEPYEQVAQACLIPVHVHDERGRFFYRDFVRHAGLAYCHQGIIFPSSHPRYLEEYPVAADLDLMIACFPQGVAALPRVSGGGVRFDLGGASSQAGKARDVEVRSIFYRRLPWWTAMRLQAGIAMKNLVPRKLRRALVRSSWHGDIGGANS